MKSKTLSLLRYRIIYIAISLAILILIIEDKWYIIILPFYSIYIMRKQKDLTKYILLIMSIFCISYQVNREQSIDISAQYNVKVIKVNNVDSYTSFTGMIEGVMVNGYLSDRMEMEPGDLYSVKGELQIPIHNTIPSGFDYKEYLLSKRIFYQIYIDEIEYVGHRFNLGILNYKINNYIDQNLPLSKSYIKTFVLADKSDFDQSTIDAINKLGISHIFAVSGLHIGLLVLGMKKVLNLLQFKDKSSDILITIVLAIYIIITGYSPSVIRAGTMFFMIVMNKRLNLKFSNLDLLSLILILLLLLNPYFYKNQGFVLSFLVTFLLLLNSDLLRKNKGMKLLFLVSFISFIGTLPIIFAMNHQINLLSLIYNIVFVMTMTVVILPLSYITFIFPIFDMGYYALLNAYNLLIDVASRCDLLIIKGTIVYTLNIIVYYIYIYYLFDIFSNFKVKFKHILFLALIIVISLNLNLISPKKRVVFLDVIGDSTFISDSYNRCNILIDTGESDEFDSVINYLLSVNVRKLDYLFISHFHSDHFGEYQDIADKIDVKTSISPQNIQKYYNTELTCGSIKIYLYELSNSSSNENNNSLILSVFIEDKHYLFVGDSEIERENEFIKNYHVDVDYLKVAHHGSNTSSSIEFIESVNPQEAFVMVYRNNIFGHPNFFIMNRYSSRNIPIYRTDLLGTVEVTYLFGNERKKYCKP